MPWTDEQIDQFVDDCYDKMEQKQKTLEEKFGLGHFDSFWLDQETGTLKFKQDDTVKVEAKFIPIGSHSSSSNTWMWAWANSSLLPELSQRSAPLKKLAHNDSTGLKIFELESWEAGEQEAWEMVAIGCEIFEGEGVYRCPGKLSDLYVVLVDVN